MNTRGIDLNNSIQSKSLVYSGTHSKQTLLRFCLATSRLLGCMISYVQYEHHGYICSLTHANPYLLVAASSNAPDKGPPKQPIVVLNGSRQCIWVGVSKVGGKAGHDALKYTSPFDGPTSSLRLLVQADLF